MADIEGERFDKNSFYNSRIIDKAYMAKKLLDLSYLFQSQVSQVYRKEGMICSFTLLFLSSHGPASITEVAQALEHPIRPLLNISKP